MEDRLKDIDAVQRAQHLKSLGWSLYAGVLGVAAGTLAGGVFGRMGLGLLIGIALGTVFFLGSFFFATTISAWAGRFAGTLYNPSGRSTPYRSEFSEAQSMVARGRYEDAAAAYEVAALEYPDDPEPRMRLARLLRDELERPQDAVVWFKRAREAAEGDAGAEILATHEIIEIHTHKLGDARRALPELARLADRYPGHPAGERARRELRALKEELRES